jgi:hypothetical protein
MSFYDLYSRYWKDLVPYLKENPDLSRPLLMDFPDKYKEQKIKLLVCGQQTNGWENIELSSDTAVIHELMCRYKNGFRMGLLNRSDGKPYRSPFWNFVRKLECKLDIEKGEILWTNLNKVDQKDKRPSLEIEEQIRRLFLVVPEEIKLAKPDIIIFLTGHQQKRCFDDQIIEINRNISFNQIDNDYDKNIFAKLEHNDLPTENCFRIDHPGHLVFRGSRIYNDILNKIVEYSSLS